MRDAQDNTNFYYRAFLNRWRRAGLLGAKGASPMRAVVGRESVVRSRGSALRADGVGARLMRLHDGPAQLLALALMQLDRLMSGRDACRSVQLREVRALVDEALRDTRRVLDDCIVPEVSQASFAASLTSLGRRLSSFTGQVLCLDCAAEVRAPPAAVAEAILRATRELLINSCKHAPGSRIELTLSVLGEGFEITIRDDGPGFDPGVLCRARGAAGGYGLCTLPDHLARVGARFRLYSRPGAGVVAHIRWPDDGPGHN